MASFEENMESRVELRVRHWRPAIVQCIQTHQLCTRLASKGIITDAEKTRICDLYRNKSFFDASNELLDIVIRKKQAHKWALFLEALDDEGMEYVKSRLIASDIELPEEREHGKTMLQFFGPDLEKQIDEPLKIARLLKNKKVITDVDLQEITNSTLQRSTDLAVHILLTRMQCHKRPAEWYYEFLCSLRDEGYQHLAKQLEPDFLNNPSACMPKFGPIQHSKKEKEHVLEDNMEFEPSNDLNAPAPSTSETFESKSETEVQEKILQKETDSGNLIYSTTDTENLKDLNIKPERMKSVEEFKDKTNESDEESEEENTLASDYESSDAEEEKPKPHSLELRDYQIELAEDAIKGRNTIICAETGTGKTWVALHIVASHLAAASNWKPRKVVFMARTGVLIKQQANRFKRFLPQYQTKLITGEEEDSRMIDAFVPNYDIMCFTPQILVNNLDSKNIETLSKFSLLVFDECHHTRGDEPYARLARRYLVEKGRQTAGLPQMIGLTASVGVGPSRTVEEAVDHILHICARLDTTLLSTVERCKESLLKWVNIPKEEVVKMVTRVPDPGRDIMLNAMDDTESLLEDMAFLQPDLTDLMIEKKPAEKESQAYNKWTGDIEKAAQLNVTDHETARDISSCARYLNVYNSALEVNNLLQLKHVIKYLADKHNLEMQGKSKHTDQEKILFKKLLDVQKKLSARAREKDTENPNVKIVSDQLRQMIQEKGDDSRAIVFVKARATCRALAEYIDRDLREIGVRAHSLYGQQTRGADEGMTESVQTETVEKFREGHYKVMVCTSVGTEGIDVPDCNIVVNYNYSGDEITKIQMKGRSRKKGATHVIVGSDKQVEQEMVNAYKANMMYKAMDDFKRLNPKNIGYKVAIYQKEEMQKHRYKMEYEKAKKSKMSEDDLEILCRRCNTKACLVSDIRKLGHDHLVLDKSFANRITTKPHKSPKKYDGIEKKSKMFCKKCPLDWGIVAERDGVDLWILKIQCFKFRNMRSADVSAYKKWIEVPYAVPEMNLEDIPKFFGTVDEVA
ncbi:antiviral innate immune response receptor RIG-I-like isoform X2 [Mya arenaria]|uniref:antiviral innate immune response receptor RIG-I-like isoform X2 n=1 Tax=Mya arenaria TaxID=6604 RepID=UPI0022E6A514|nr:antiviral innate immune response receptor RIG-I-like isoform X2 [Mya arenaria]